MARDGETHIANASCRTGASRPHLREGFGRPGKGAVRITGRWVWVLPLMFGCGSPIPELETTEEVRAKPAYVVEERLVGRGQTLSELLTGVVDASEWGDAMVAFSGQGNARLLQAGSKVLSRREGEDGPVREIDV